MTNGRIIGSLFIAAAGFLSVSAPLSALTGGALTAAPANCQPSAGQTYCATTISWNSFDSSPTQVWVKDSVGGPENLFGCGGLGTKDFSLVQAGHTYTFTLYASSDCNPTTKGAVLRTAVVTGTMAAPVITSPGSARGITGQFFHYPIAATGSPTSYGVSGLLPPGLQLNRGAESSIQGTPTAAGSYPVTLSANNAGGTGTQTILFTIAEPPKPVIAPPFIISPASAQGQVGLPFVYLIQATNNPTSYAAFGLPSGMTINTLTGLVSGTPAAATPVPLLISIQAANSGGIASSMLSLMIYAQSQPPLVLPEPVTPPPLGPISPPPITPPVTPPVTQPPPANQHPVARITAAPLSGQAPLTVSFNGLTSSDPDGSIVRYQWDLGDGHSAEDAVTSHTYAANGFYNVRLTVTDNAGISTHQTILISVIPIASPTNRPPIASFTTEPTSGNAPLVVTFDASASRDPDGKIASMEWNFGDGITSGGILVHHTYNAPGTFTARLTIRDEFGLTAEQTTSITVGPELPMPGEPQNYARLSIGAFTVAAGARIRVPVQFTPGPTPVSSLQFNFVLPDGIGDVYAEAGSAIAEGGKSIGTNLEGVTFRVLIFGSGSRDPILGGDLVYIFLGTKTSASGTQPLNINGISGSMDGVSVPVAGTDGTLTFISPRPVTAPIVLVPAPRVYPNPWRSDRPASAVTFEGMAANSTVKIFTISGRWVNTLAAPAGTVPWDLKNADGDSVASGLYIYLITDDQGGRIRGTLAVIR